jgi:hypothetical protein
VTEFELHVAHLPPSSTRGPVKVEMFEALHTRLATPCNRPPILCGYLNTPRAERDDGTVEFWGARHPPYTAFDGPVETLARLRSTPIRSCG